MQMTYFPVVVQVVPFPDHTVSVYFSNGKIVSYNVRPLLDKGVFRALRDMDVFTNRCAIMNDTLVWNIAGNGYPTACIDIDPETLYALDAIEDRLSAS